jgi:hypothetical protein
MDNFDIFNAGSNPEMIPNKRLMKKQAMKKLKLITSLTLLSN